MVTRYQVTLSSMVPGSAVAATSRRTLSSLRQPSPASAAYQVSARPSRKTRVTALGPGSSVPAPGQDAGRAHRGVRVRVVGPDPATLEGHHEPHPARANSPRNPFPSDPWSLVTSRAVGCHRPARERAALARTARSAPVASWSGMAVRSSPWRSPGPRCTALLAPDNRTAHRPTDDYGLAGEPSHGEH